MREERLPIPDRRRPLVVSAWRVRPASLVFAALVLDEVWELELTQALSRAEQVSLRALAQWECPWFQAALL